ncbi:MAG: triple tyrosine motif-containing protein [Verrucomicrobia bacterium]|nr:triple tyrosine motif-containing protein [Verrucomicrobiota bacterium]
MLVPMIFHAGRCWLASLLVGFASGAWAASTNSAWISRAWQTEDGLPGNTVVGVAQTPDGFLWVATESGLARFDGVRFQETAPLPNPNLSFLADRRGRLWLGKRTATAGGEVVCVEEGKSRVFTTEDGLPDQGASGMAEDGEGAVWISAGLLLCRIQDGRGTVFSSESGLPSVGGKLCLAGDTQGQIWVARGSQAGVYRDGRFRTLLTLKEPCGALSGARSGGAWIGAGTRVLKYSGQGEPQDLGELAAGRPEVKPTVLCEDRRGRLWVGTERAGLFLYNGAGFDEVALAKREILCLTDDREGSLWVGSRGGGLVRVRPRAFELEMVVSAPSPDAMQSLCQDASGTLWAVTQSGRLARKDGPHWRVLSAEDGWSGEVAACVAPAPEGGVWVGTRSGGLRLWRQVEVRVITRQDGLASGFVNALLTTPTGDVWLGTLDSNAVHRLRDNQLQTFMLPQVYGHFGSLAVDASGGFWAATEGGVLTRVSQEGLVDQTTNTLGEHHPITSLCATPEGSLWIGYQGMGVGRLRQGHFTRFGTQQGLQDDYLIHIVADGWGRLWFAANRGLFWVAQSDFDAVAEGRQARVRSVVYGQDEGLPGLQAYKGYWPGAMRSADGRLWIPMVSGLLVVDPSRLTENREPPRVVIERVVADGQAVGIYEVGPQPRAPGSTAPLDLRRPGARLRLAPGSRQVELEYTGLSFVSPRNVTFKYRLAGFEPDWVEADARRAAYYSHLPPGDYRFEVMACNNDGVWNEAGAALAITVLPHVWETVWFRLVGLAVGMAGLVGTGSGIARRRARRRLANLEQAAALDRERARIARDIHDDLGAGLTQISLVSALARADATDAEDARAANLKVEALARDLMRSLDEIVWAVRPQNDNLPSLVEYLGYAARDLCEGSDVRCWFSSLPTVPTLAVSASVRHNLLLACREAINNVLKHSDATEVHIRLQLEAGDFRVEIADNGHGFEVAAGEAKRSGLLHIRQRLTEIGGRCEFDSVLGRGTTVRLTLPLESAGRSAPNLETRKP